MIEVTNPVTEDLWKEEKELQKNQDEYWGENPYKEINEVENGKEQ